MFTYNPVEGVDYIFDRYAFLGLEPDATEDVIEEVIKLKRGENHPDRLVKAGPKVLETAQRQRDLLDQAAQILLNPEIRPLYDVRLAEFKQQSPGLISSDGREIIDLSGRRFRFDLDRLLGDDPSKSIDVEAKVGSYRHFDEKDFTRKQRLYKKYPDDDVRIEYRQALLTKLTHVTLLEDMAWARAGVDRPPSHAMDRILAPADHVEAVEEKIDQVATGIIPAYVQQRGGLMMLGMAKNPLLLPGSADAPAAAAPVENFTADAVIAQAQRNFQQRSEQIKEIASQKSQLLAEILPFLDV